MIEPVLSEQEFLADVTSPVSKTSELRLWWLGQSGYLIRHRDVTVIIDPYLSDSLTAKYAGTDKPHVRMHRRVVDPAELGRQLGAVTLVTSSHAHTDHLDPATLRPLLESTAFVGRVISPRPSCQLAYERCAAGNLRHPPRFETLDESESWDIKDLSVTAIPSAHSTIERDEAGDCKFLGYVFRFCFFPRDPPMADRVWDPEPVHEWSVYHSGDTVVYEGLADRLRLAGLIDVAILPINGQVGNMGGRDAARLAKDIGAKLVIPCHYEMFEFNTADPRDEFIPECERIGQPYKVLRAGERLTLGA